jgi:GNAT superfamily N-acetyltransferase
METYAGQLHFDVVPNCSLQGHERLNQMLTHLEGRDWLFQRANFGKRGFALGTQQPEFNQIYYAYLARDRESFVDLEVVGFIFLDGASRSQAEVAATWVHPEFRKQGLGLLLHAWAADEVDGFHIGPLRIPAYDAFLRRIHQRLKDAFELPFGITPLDYQGKVLPVEDFAGASTYRWDLGLHKLVNTFEGFETLELDYHKPPLSWVEWKTLDKFVNIAAVVQARVEREISGS